ncbi:hypothetical protein B0J12DRAFT_675412, partial [Macrophomina phaseolina]
MRWSSAERTWARSSRSLGAHTHTHSPKRATEAEAASPVGIGWRIPYLLAGAFARTHPRHMPPPLPFPPPLADGRYLVAFCPPPPHPLHPHPPSPPPRPPSPPPPRPSCSTRPPCRLTHGYSVTEQQTTPRLITTSETGREQGHVARGTACAPGASASVRRVLLRACVYGCMDASTHVCKAEAQRINRSSNEASLSVSDTSWGGAFSLFCDSSSF